MKVFVAGAGTMGAGIAQVFAVCAHDVMLFDVSAELAAKGREMIEARLNKLVGKSELTVEEKLRIVSRIGTSTAPEDAKSSGLVVEAITENAAIKKEFWKQIDSACGGDTIFASNTSSLSITELAAIVHRPERFIGMHFFNPAPLMKLVEIIRGIATSEETLRTTKEITVSVGKEPIEVQEAPGFVVNRILIPMINEAIGILAEGLATAEDIDKAMKLGANHPLGPLALADLIGNDVNLSIMEVLYSETGDSKYRPHPLLRKMVRGRRLGRKTKRGFFEYK